MSEPKYIDEAGRTWLKFTVSFRNEIDDMTFSISLWAIDLAHAEDQLHWLKQNGKVDGQIVGEIDARS